MIVYVSLCVISLNKASLLVMLLVQKNLFRSSVDLLGPYDFYDAENMDIIMEFNHKNGIYCLIYWNLEE